MRKKRIAFFVTSLNPGGIENYLLRFLQFSEGRIKPFVICKGDRLGDLEEDYKKIDDINLIVLDSTFPYLNLRMSYQVYNILKKNKIQTVCDFTGNFAGSIMLVARFGGIDRRIAFYRNSRIRFKESRLKLLYNNYMRFLVKIFSTRILSNSIAALDYFFPGRRSGDPHFKVIYNGIDNSRFSINVDKKHLRKEIGIPEDGFIIGHVGRYNSQKNHGTILKVAERIISKYNNIYFVLCGKGTKENLSEMIADNEILKRHVILLGYRRDVNRILNVFDLFFFPSTIEGQPNALIEAMISGVPIVASNIMPIKETTPPKFHPMLRDPLDVNGFVKEIERVYLDPEYRNEMVFTEWAKNHFDPDILFTQFLNEL